MHWFSTLSLPFCFCVLKMNAYHLLFYTQPLQSAFSHSFVCVSMSSILSPEGYGFALHSPLTVASWCPRTSPPCRSSSWGHRVCPKSLPPLLCIFGLWKPTQEALSSRFLSVAIAPGGTCASRSPAACPGGACCLQCPWVSFAPAVLGPPLSVACSGWALMHLVLPYPALYYAPAHANSSLSRFPPSSLQTFPPSPPALWGLPGPAHSSLALSLLLFLCADASCRYIFH